MTQIGEGVITPSPPDVDKPCEDEGNHDWEEVDSGVSADDQVNKLEGDIKP